MNANLKRYLVSSGVTFVTAFVISLGIQFQAGVPVTITGSFLLSILGVALRAGVKALGEYMAGSTGDVVPPAQTQA